MIRAFTGEPLTTGTAERLLKAASRATAGPGADVIMAS